MAAPSKVAVCLFSALFGLFAVGVFDFLRNHEENACEMTWMFEYPIYEKLRLLSKVTKAFPRYGLYIYGEGERARRNRELDLTGIPVLFIPGNAGSYKQVRSLGSVSLRKAMDMKKDFHFDYYSVDFDEDLSGLFGGVLNEQVEFVHQSIRHVLRLYKKKQVKSVILVGHSMGGMVARALFTLPKFDRTTVHTIITQATPHQMPVISIDSYLADFYSKVNDFWSNSDNISDVTVVTTAGSYRDRQIRHQLAMLNGIVSEDRAVSTSTSSVPLAWVSTDHLCSVWCRQMVLVTVRALFDIVDKTTKQVENNAHYKVRVFHHHFVDHTGVKDIDNRWLHSMLFDSKSKWEFKTERRWRLVTPKVKTSKHIAVSLPTEQNWYMTIQTNMELDAWLFGCIVPEGAKNCLSGDNLSSKGTLLPPLYSNKKVVSLGPEELKDYSHVVLILPKTYTQMEISYEIYPTEDRHIDLQVPGFLSWLANCPQSLVKPVQVTTETSERALYYRINLFGLESVRQAFTLSLFMKSCQQNPDGINATVVKFKVPWNHEDSFTSKLALDDMDISLKLQSAKPDGFNGDPSIHLYLHPSCTYHISIKTSYTEILGQIVRFYGVLMPTFLICNILMALAWQLKHFKLDGEASCPSFLESYGSYCQPWRTAPLVMIISRTLRYPVVAKVVLDLGLPADDHDALFTRQISWHYLLSPLLLLLSGSILVIQSILLDKIIWILSSVIGFICNRCCLSNVVQKVGSCLQYSMLLVGAYLSLKHCGSMGILVCYMLQLCKVIKERVTAQYGSGIEQKRSQAKYSIQFTLFLLLMAILIINAPSLIVWAKNIRYSLYLTTDPSTKAGITLTLLYAILQVFPLKSNAFHFSPRTIFVTVLLLQLYCIQSLHRVTYGLTFVLAIVTLENMISTYTVKTVKEKTN